MKKYRNELKRIEKRLNAIEENKHYADYHYMMTSLDKKIAKAKTLRQNQKHFIEQKYITLKYEELSKEMNDLTELKEKYIELIEDFDSIENMQDVKLR